MQLVINISEDSYKATCNGCMLPPDVKNVIKAIKDGTPLPKGHGNLIDYYDAVELINNKVDEVNSSFTIGDIEKFGALLREVNPIIKADGSAE